MNNFSLIKGYVSKNTNFVQGMNGKKSVFSTNVAVATGATDAAGKKVYSWLPVKSFGKTAELMNQHLVAGDYVEVSGRLSMNSNYTKDGKVVYGTMFLAVTEFSRLTQRTTTTTQAASLMQPVVEPTEEVVEAVGMESFDETLPEVVGAVL